MSDAEHPDLFEDAHARGADPETSQAAAESIDDLRASQEAVLRVLRSCGPAHDEALIEAYARYAGSSVPAQSDSGIRSRRAELVRRALVFDTGEKATLPSGRHSIIWRAVPAR